MTLSKKHIFILLIFTFGCLENPTVDSTEDYFRIFDINTQLKYEAYDIKSLSDGYLIYGNAIIDSSQGKSLVYNLPYFLKINEFGIVEWDTLFPAYRDNRDKTKRVDNSRKHLINIGENYFFTGYPQDQNDNQIRLLSFNISTKELNTIFTFDEPIEHIEAVDMAINESDGGFYASASQCFNSSSQPDQVSLYYFSDAGVLMWNKIVAESYMCKRFLNSTEETQPTDLYHDIGFVRTKAGTDYVYMKTAINEEIDDRQFKILFLEPSTGDTIFSNLYTDVQIIFDGDESDLYTGMPIDVYTDGDDSLRLATANFTPSGEEILYPTIEINTGNSEVTFNESEFSSNELELGTRILIEESTVNGIPLLIYAGTTREGRILLAAFDQTSGRLLNKKYFGYNSYYEVGAINQTDDQGLIIAGHTLTAGRFQQLAVVKISQSRLAELLN